MGGYGPVLRDGHMTTSRSCEENEGASASNIIDITSESTSTKEVNYTPPSEGATSLTPVGEVRRPRRKAAIFGELRRKSEKC